MRSTGIVWELGQRQTPFLFLVWILKSMLEQMYSTSRMDNRPIQNGQLSFLKIINVFFDLLYIKTLAVHLYLIFGMEVIY